MFQPSVAVLQWQLQQAPTVQGGVVCDGAELLQASNPTQRLFDSVHCMNGEAFKSRVVFFRGV
jgi:hypothetical protein